MIRSFPMSYLSFCCIVIKACPVYRDCDLLYGDCGPPCAETGSVDVAVFCLALMGTDYPTFLAEATRCDPPPLHHSPAAPQGVAPNIHQLYRIRVHSPAAPRPCTFTSSNASQYFSGQAFCPGICVVLGWGSLRLETVRDPGAGLVSVLP